MLGDLWRLDVRRMAWTDVTGPDAPEPRYGHAASAAGGRVCVFGGRVGSGAGLRAVTRCVPLMENVRSSVALLVVRARRRG